MRNQKNEYFKHPMKFNSWNKKRLRYTPTVKKILQNNNSIINCNKSNINKFIENKISNSSNKKNDIGEAIDEIKIPRSKKDGYCKKGGMNANDTKLKSPIITNDNIHTTSENQRKEGEKMEGRRGMRIKNNNENKDKGANSEIKGEIKRKKDDDDNAHNQNNNITTDEDESENYLNHLQMVKINLVNGLRKVKGSLSLIKLNIRRFKKSMNNDIIKAIDDMRMRVKLHTDHRVLEISKRSARFQRSNEGLRYQIREERLINEDLMFKIRKLGGAMVEYDPRYELNRYLEKVIKWIEERGLYDAMMNDIS